MSQEMKEQSFQIDGLARLKIGNIRGSIEILPGEAGAVVVSAVKYTDSGDDRRTMIHMSQAEDGKVTVETRYQDIWWAFFSFSKPCKVDYRVQIPPSCEVDASGVSSSIAAQDLDGSFKFSTVSGEMKLSNLTGALKLSTVSGSIGGEKLSGKMDLNTVSGDVRFVEAALVSADMSTVSGDMRLQSPLTEGPYRFHSVSGNVWLSVPQETACSVDLHSVSGSVNANLPITRQKAGGGHSTLDVQGGGVRVSANSVSGDLFVEVPDSQAERVSLSPDEMPKAPKPPVGPSVVDRQTILDRIENGEMTVEEGLKALGSKS
jgi:DUF4097 and DUF4098 domain-containing protein YvlB